MKRHHLSVHIRTEAENISIGSVSHGRYTFLALMESTMFAKEPHTKTGEISPFYMYEWFCDLELILSLSYQFYFEQSELFLTHNLGLQRILKNVFVGPCNSSIAQF